MKAIDSDAASQRLFAAYLLAVGDGRLASAAENGDSEVIQMPAEMCATSLQELLDFPFGKGDPTTGSTTDCALLAPKNDIVNGINSVMLERVPGEAYTYYSADETISDDRKPNLHILLPCTSRAISHCRPHVHSDRSCTRQKNV